MSNYVPFHRFSHDSVFSAVKSLGLGDDLPYTTLIDQVWENFSVPYMVFGKRAPDTVEVLTQVLAESTAVITMLAAFELLSPVEFIETFDKAITAMQAHPSHQLLFGQMSECVRAEPVIIRALRECLVNAFEPTLVKSVRQELLSIFQPHVEAVTRG